MEPAEIERFRVGLGRVAVRQGAFDRWLRLVIRGLFRVVAWRVEVTGLDRLPRSAGRRGAGCLIVPSPHRAWIDPFLLLAVWPVGAARLVWFGDGPTMTRSWWRRWLFPRLGMIPISPGSGGPRAYAAMAAEVLSAGAALVIFPEKGPPSAPDATRTIAPGFAYLAITAGAHVVPVVLGGTHRVVRGSPFTVDILDAMVSGPPDPAAFTPSGRARSAATVATYRAAVLAVLPVRTALADDRRPSRDRWPWLATLFH